MPLDARARDRARITAQTIEGWLSDEQGAALFDAAARSTGRGAVVEIGSWKGKSTVWLGLGAQSAGRHVFAVDPHTGSAEDPSARTLDVFTANMELAGIAGTVTPLVMTSLDAAVAVPASVEVLFIDGDHSEAGVRIDAAIWLPRLVEGATVMFHDVATTSFTGPRRVFQRSICWSGGFDHIHRVGSMGVARKAARASLPAVARGWAAGLLLYLFDAKRLLNRIRGK